MTSACCWGTTRIAFMTTMMATTNSASVTIEEPISISFSVNLVSGTRGSALRQNQHGPAQRGDVHGLDLWRIGRREFGVPGAAAISDARGPVGTPGQHLNLSADVERRLLRRLGGDTSLPALQPHGADHAEYARDQPLNGNWGAGQRGNPAARHREPDDEQIK